MEGLIPSPLCHNPWAPQVSLIGCGVPMSEADSAHRMTIFHLMGNLGGGGALSLPTWQTSWRSTFLGTHEKLSAPLQAPTPLGAEAAFQAVWTLGVACLINVQPL